MRVFCWFYQIFFCQFVNVWKDGITDYISMKLLVEEISTVIYYLNMKIFHITLFKILKRICRNFFEDMYIRYQYSLKVISRLNVFN